MKMIIMATLIICSLQINAQSSSIPVMSAEQKTPVVAVVEQKNVKEYPHKGTFAIGMNAMPVVNFVGNLFRSSNNYLDISNLAIYGKYFISDKIAFRAVINTDMGSKNYEYYVRDDAAYIVDPLQNKQAVDKMDVINNSWFLSLAFERYTGISKLRGFYGAQVIGAYHSGKINYTYANPMTTLNPMPSIGSMTQYNNNERYLEFQNSNTVKLGLGLLAGVEYYLSPNVCIGGEVSLNAVCLLKGQEYTRSEKVVGSKVKKQDKAVSPGGTEFSLKTLSFSSADYQDQLGFYVMFHF